MQKPTSRASPSCGGRAGTKRREADALQGAGAREKCRREAGGTKAGALTLTFYWKAGRLT
jgi:hypothetical protein